MAITASLHIVTGLREGITYLKKSFCTTPFKVANITEDKKATTLQLMLMSSSPGILDGDRYEMKIDLEPGTSLQLQTQSYQRLYHMQQGASQNLEVRLGEGASFCFLPHPSVPHASSSFITKNKFYLAKNCSLIFGEVLTCGRKLNGEAFLFSKYHSITEVFICDKLVLKENLLIAPATIDVNTIGQLEGYTHQASLIYQDEHGAIKTISPLINELLSIQNDITFGISTTPVNGLVVRILGQKAEQLHECLKGIAGLIGSPVAGVQEK
ncbi:MAG: urease accessory protein UreD [Chitinophagaceae bacterium]